MPEEKVSEKCSGLEKLFEHLFELLVNIYVILGKIVLAMLRLWSF